jgi:hypothetical protein
MAYVVDHKAAHPSAKSLNHACARGEIGFDVNDPLEPEYFGIARGIHEGSVPAGKIHNVAAAQPMLEMVQQDLALGRRECRVLQPGATGNLRVRPARQAGRAIVHNQYLVRLQNGLVYAIDPTAIAIGPYLGGGGIGGAENQGLQSRAQRIATPIVPGRTLYLNAPPRHQSGHLALRTARGNPASGKPPLARDALKETA